MEKVLAVIASWDDADQVLARLVGRGLPVVGFGEEQGDLEDVFMQVTQRAEAA